MVDHDRKCAIEALEPLHSDISNHLLQGDQCELVCQFVSVVEFKSVLERVWSPSSHSKEWECDDINWNSMFEIEKRVGEKRSGDKQQTIRLLFRTLIDTFKKDEKERTRPEEESPKLIGIRTEIRSISFPRIHHLTSSVELKIFRIQFEPSVELVAKLKHGPIERSIVRQTIAFKHSTSRALLRFDVVVQEVDKQRDRRFFLRINTTEIDPKLILNLYQQLIGLCSNESSEK
jgi:hypothetical protein